MAGVKTGLSITGLLVFGTTTSLFAKIGKANVKRAVTPVLQYISHQLQLIDDMHLVQYTSCKAQISRGT